MRRRPARTHIRLLRLMSTEPPHLDAVNRQM
jgi:hypothetical protein